MYNENDPLLKAFFRNKWIIAILIVDIIAILVVIGVFIYQSTKVSTISFDVAPLKAKISVNGDSHYTNGQFPITPGKYEVRISYEGLETKTLTVNIEPHDFVSVTTFIKGADNNFEFYEMKDNDASYQKLKAIASAEKNLTTDNDESAQEFITTLEKKLSIKDKLPLKGYVYSASGKGASTGGYAIHGSQSSKSCKKSTCLVVKYYGKDYKNPAIAKIKEAGYNPDDYEIVYERYKQ